MKTCRVLILVAVAALLMASPGFATEAEHGGEASHGDPLLPYKWVNFAILAGGLGYLFVKFAFPAFGSQQKEILEALNRASRQAEDVAGRMREADQKIANLNQEIESLRRKAAAEMQAEARRVEEETAAALRKIEHGLEADLASAARAARKDLKAYSAELALQLARTKTAERMTDGTQGDLVARFAIDLSGRAGR